MSSFLNKKYTNKTNTECDVVLINPPYKTRPGGGLTIPLGLAYLAAYLRTHGISVQILDCAPVYNNNQPFFIDWFQNQLLRKKPKFAIGIGPCTTSTIYNTVMISKIIKNIYPNIKIIYGGPLASVKGQERIFFEDLSATAIIPGDGEKALTSFLKTIQKDEDINSLDGIVTNKYQHIKCNIIQNLDELPFPARDLFDSANYYPSLRRNLFKLPFTTFITSRGCNYNCGFCLGGQIRNGKKTRSLNNISEELTFLSNKFGTKSIIFYDDLLFDDNHSINDDVIDFCNIITKVSKNLLWQIEMRPDLACLLEDKSINMLFNAGCRQINFGIEKSSNKSMDAIKKSLDTDKSSEACNRIYKICKRMRLAGTFIIGGPGETREDIMDIIEYSKKLNLLFAHFNPLELYPGTSLYENKFKNDPEYWYRYIMEYKGSVSSLIYEENALTRNVILALTSKAYRIFYHRKKWLNLAKNLLGTHFDDVKEIIYSWNLNRYSKV